MPKPLIQIIKASKKHSDLIVELGRQAFLESHGHSASKEEIDQFILKTYNKSCIDKEFESTTSYYHIIYFNKKAAGFSKIELDSPNPNIKELSISKLDRIYLLKRFYGQKLGLTLFNFIIEFSKQKNQKGIWLATWVKNQRAIRFYSKAGFKIVGKYDFKISDTHSNPNHILFLNY